MREHRSGDLEPDKVANCIGTFGRAFEELDDMLAVAKERYKPINAFQAFLRTIWFITVRQTGLFPIFLSSLVLLICTMLYKHIFFNRA